MCMKRKCLIKKSPLVVRLTLMFDIEDFIYVKGGIVGGTVYGDMHLKDRQGLITREAYCIPVLDLYLALHGL